MKAEFDWSAVSDHSLAQLARDYSAAQIAKELGCSRNAVIGRCRRRNISLSRYIVSTVDPIVRESNRRNRQRQRYAAKRAKLLGIPLPAFNDIETAIVEPIAEPDRPGITIMDLHDGSCRYPLWSADTAPADKRYCGVETEVGQVYCAYCSRLCYSPRRTESLDRKLGIPKFARAA